MQQRLGELGAQGVRGGGVAAMHPRHSTPWDALAVPAMSGGMFSASTNPAQRLAFSGGLVPGPSLEMGLAQPSPTAPQGNIAMPIGLDAK